MIINDMPWTISLLGRMMFVISVRKITKTLIFDGYKVAVVVVVVVVGPYYYCWCQYHYYYFYWQEKAGLQSPSISLDSSNTIYTQTDICDVTFWHYSINYPVSKNRDRREIVTTKTNNNGKLIRLYIICNRSRY